MARPNNQFTAVNATDITDTTAQTIKAAPSDTTYQAYEIDHVSFVNRTGSEAPTILIVDGDGTEIDRVQFLDKGSIALSYNPPKRVATGKAIKGKALSSVGDTTITITGRLIYVGS